MSNTSIINEIVDYFIKKRPKSNEKFYIDSIYSTNERNDVKSLHHMFTNMQKHVL